MVASLTQMEIFEMFREAFHTNVHDNSLVSLKDLQTLDFKLLLCGFEPCLAAQDRYICT